MLRRLGFVFTLASLVCASIVACGDDDDATVNDPSQDGGSDGQQDVAVASENEAKQTGKIIKAQTENEGVAGATVTAGNTSVTTNAAGDYEMIVPRNTPYRMTVSAPDYFKLLEQEVIVKTASLARGNTNLLPTATANLLAGLLPDRKAEKGLVVVKVNPLPPCTSEEGSVVTIDPPGEAKVTYFEGSFPKTSLTAAKAGATFSAAIYNVEVGVPLKVTVTSPDCAEVAFPVDVGDVTYTATLSAEPGEALSYMRVFIRDTAEPDAGGD